MPEGQSASTNTLMIRAVDNALNNGSAGSAIYKKDTTPPSEPNITTSPVATSTLTNDKSPTIVWSNITDAHCGVVAQAQYQINGGSWINIPTASGISGALMNTIGTMNPYRYRGYRYDNETGWYYLKSRYYNPIWQRFINADSIIFSNLFSYCFNNPVMRIDQTGCLSAPLNVSANITKLMYEIADYVGNNAGNKKDVLHQWNQFANLVNKGWFLESASYLANNWHTIAMSLVYEVWPFIYGQGEPDFNGTVGSLSGLLSIRSDYLSSVERYKSRIKDDVLGSLDNDRQIILRCQRIWRLMKYNYSEYDFCTHKIFSYNRYYDSYENVRTHVKVSWSTLKTGLLAYRDMAVKNADYYKYDFKKIYTYDFAKHYNFKFEGVYDIAYTLY